MEGSKFIGFFYEWFYRNDFPHRGAIWSAPTCSQIPNVVPVWRTFLMVNNESIILSPVLEAINLPLPIPLPCGLFIGL